MFFKASNKSRRGFSLVEVMVASVLFGLVGLALGSIYLFSTRTFAAMANYATLDQNNRLGMDKLTREIRESRAIMSASTNGNSASINLINNSGDSITYKFDASAQALTRTVNASAPQVIIPNCQVLDFTVGQRTPTNGTFDAYPKVSTNDSIQVITLTWRAWKRIPGSAVGTSEEIQTANVVVRNQHYVQDGGVVFSE